MEEVSSQVYVVGDEFFLFKEMLGPQELLFNFSLSVLTESIWQDIPNVPKHGHVEKIWLCLYNMLRGREGLDSSHLVLRAIFVVGWKVLTCYCRVLPRCRAGIFAIVPGPGTEWDSCSDLSRVYKQ